MKHTFLFSAGLCVAAVLAINSAQALDIYKIMHSIKKETLNDVVLCSSNENKTCQLELGFAYLYEGEFKDKKISKNIDKASQLLESSSMLPFSRYLLGNIYLNKQGKNKIGLSLMQSACVENVENACVIVADKYAKNENCNNLNVYCNLDGNINKAIRYEEKAISLAEIKLKNKSIDEVEASLIKRDLLSYNIKLSVFLIKNNDPRGVALLESINIDDISFNVEKLARVYEEGKIVPRDLVKSYIYYDLMGVINDHEDKQRLEKIMTLSQLHEAQERSWNWQEQHHSYRPGYRSPADYDF